ncbi:hypothetical protein OG194_18420 [Streptomyces sp. NBC_01288]|uniref:hypothetical protein n=1 Tax=Streptomyces sp. NBC_01288 TaxID=2903814 RepID=UPI002E12A56C|nr:hypothetical protein OG194_18420 [Streptomyces sp. NBC_01288]
MPTYHEIMTTDLAALTTAAERWDGMAGEFEKQEAAYRRDVHGISVGTSWTGLSADAANARFDVTLKEFQYAQTEAKGIAALLRDAHDRFVELRGRVVAARWDAVRAGMRVSESGVVSPSSDQPHTPAAPQAVQPWQDGINKAVRDVTDADTGVRVALAGVVIDSELLAGGRGFNGRAMGDIEAYEAEETERYLRKLSRGGELTAPQLAELERSFRDNSEDEGFSQMVLDDLGPTGTIKLTNELNDRVHVQGGAGAGTYSSIETGLANTLATATRHTKSAWYGKWRTAMRRAGVAHYATDAQGLHLDKAVGYQSLVTLMQKGHGYAPAMVEDLTDDMIAAEKKHPGVWQVKGTYAGARGGWFANDPVDGMLGIMSRDPAEAARYLHSDAHMKYLMKERDWNVTLNDEGVSKGGRYVPRLDGDDRAGFGAALQAGATGIDPADPKGVRVGDRATNDAVFKSAFTYLADSGDEFPASLRRPMANVLVNHGGTVHAAMSEVDVGHSSLDQHQLFEVAKQVSKDEGAYGILNGGMNQSLVSDIHRDHSNSPDSLTRAGRTVGFLEEARVQAAGDPKVAEFETKPFFDKAISYIPVVSSDVQAGFDYVTEQWLADEQRKLDSKQEDANVQAYTTRNGQLMALAEEWKKAHHTDGNSYFDPKVEVNKSAREGIAQATGMSGAQPK